MMHTATRACLYFFLDRLEKKVTSDSSAKKTSKTQKLENREKWKSEKNLKWEKWIFFALESDVTFFSRRSRKK